MQESRPALQCKQFSSLYFSNYLPPIQLNIVFISVFGINSQLVLTLKFIKTLFRRLFTHVAGKIHHLLHMYGYGRSLFCSTLRVIYPPFL